MKKLKPNKYLLILFALLWATIPNLSAQDDEAEEPEAPEQVVKLRYFNQDNRLHYLLLESQLKTGKRVEARRNVNLRVYLDSISDQQLMGRFNTGNTGRAKAPLPPSLADAWNASPAHEFIAIEESAKPDGEETTYTLSVQKAKLTMDTSSEDETRTITVHAVKYENGEWVPIPELELKVGINRLIGVLNAGEDDTYSTDEEGMATVEFNKDSLPGNEQGILTLVARVDDNEEFGNLRVSKTVPWGIPGASKESTLLHRSLWAPSNRAPVWLMMLAYSIIAGVWGVLLYLVFQLVKVIRLGKNLKESK